MDVLRNQGNTSVFDAPVVVQTKLSKFELETYDVCHCESSSTGSETKLSEFELTTNKMFL